MDSLVCDKFVCSRLAELWNLELTVVTRPRMSDLLTRRSFALGFGAICGVLAPQRKWALAAAEAKGASALSPPIAPIIPARFENFGATRIDHYDWLRDREDPRVQRIMWSLLYSSERAWRPALVVTHLGTSNHSFGSRGLRKPSIRLMESPSRLKAI